LVAELVRPTNMPYVTERWPGGMLTNFATIRKAVKKMSSIDKLMVSPAFLGISKRERLQITRERAKLEKNLGSIADLNKLPSAVFVVDIMKEHIAIAEARKLNIPTFAIVDTNSDPNLVDFPIPANDDASKSIALIIKKMIEAIDEGSSERKLDRDKREEEGEETEEQAASRISGDDDDDDAREVARKKRVAAGLEPADGDDRKRPRKAVTRKPAPGAARKPRI
jgi:small subunit ribosomal protein S2